MKRSGAVLAVIALLGVWAVGGCAGSGRATARHLPVAAPVRVASSACPGAGYHGRLRRDLTQPYTGRAYLLDDGSLCRPAP